MSTLKDRLIEARTAAGLSQAALAKLAKCGQTTIASIENGRNKGSAALARIADVLGVEPLWLAEGRGSRRRSRDESHDSISGAGVISPLADAQHEGHEAEFRRSLGLVPIAVWEHPDELPDGEFISVPRLNVHLSAGNGNGEQVEVDLERANPQVFRAEWARKERLKPTALASMYADGNSMEPRICDGDSLLVDTSQKTVLDGRVFAVWYAGELKVKRLYKRVDGGLLIHSDNERDYPQLEVPASQMEHVRIIGRVVHVQGTGGL